LPVSNRRPAGTREHRALIRMLARTAIGTEGMENADQDLSTSTS